MEKLKAFLSSVGVSYDYQEMMMKHDTEKELKLWIDRDMFIKVRSLYDFPYGYKMDIGFCSNNNILGYIQCGYYYRDEEKILINDVAHYYNKHTGE